MFNMCLSAYGRKMSNLKMTKERNRMDVRIEIAEPCNNSHQIKC